MMHMGPGVLCKLRTRGLNGSMDAELCSTSSTGGLHHKAADYSAHKPPQQTKPITKTLI